MMICAKNMLLLAAGNPDRGVMHDTHESNSSRRYKAFGSFWKNLCRAKNSSTPSTAHDGTLFPPCHNLGVAYSADGVHWDHAQDEDAFDPGNVRTCRNIAPWPLACTCC
jgi:hypothetical protein